MHQAIAAGWRVLLALVLVIAGTQLATRHGFAFSAAALAVAALLLLVDAGMLFRKRPAAERPQPSGSLADLRKLDRLEALLDAVSVALFVLSADGRITYMNRAALRLAGAQAARLSDIAGAGDQAAADLEALIPGGRRVVAFGDGRTALAWTGRIAAPGEPPQRLLSLQMVAGELDAVQIEAWQSMTRVLAHEMMNSLTPITSLSHSVARLVSERRMGSDLESAMETIGRRSENLLHFVERYREMATVPEPAFGPMEVDRLLDGLAHIVRQEAADAGIELEVRAAGPSASVTADAELLEHAILNLLRNAIEAVQGRPEGRITLGARLNETSCIFTVADNGPGLHAGQVEEIFVPFYTTKQTGTGIGLPLARQIALVHRGTLKVEPNSDAGVTFELEIPKRVMS